jgi:hypothetical protein
MQVTPAATLRPAAAHALRLSTGNLLSVSFIIPFFLYMLFLFDVLCATRS